MFVIYWGTHLLYYVRNLLEYTITVHYSAVMFQIVGSCAGAQFGGQKLLLLVVLMWSISTMATPLAAHSLYWLLLSRLVLGLGEGLGMKYLEFCWNLLSVTFCFQAFQQFITFSLKRFRQNNVRLPSVTCRRLVRLGKPWPRYEN